VLRADAGVWNKNVAPWREQSRKPDEFYDRMWKYVGGDKRCLELFARRKRPLIVPWGGGIDRFV